MLHKKVFRQLAFIALLLTGILQPASAQYAPDGYYFKNYVVNMVVHDDNTYSVTEDIDAFFTESRHGIFRMIPTSANIMRDVSESQDGSETEEKHYSVDVGDINVSENYSTNYEDFSVVEIRIGSADTYVEGDHHYRISYTLALPPDRVAQSDLFFQSLLGAGWNCEVKKFVFNVQFDKAVPEASLKELQIFVGDLGGHDDMRKSVLSKCSPTGFSGEVTSLNPHQAVSAFMPLPEGYFSVYDTWQVKATWACLALALFFLLIVIVKEITAGDEKVLKVLTVSPPKGMSSAELGTVFDCSVDDCDMISLIPWFASQGYISIDNTGKDPVLTKIKDLPENAPSYQSTIFKAFFAKGDKFDVGKRTTESFGKAWEKSKKSLGKNFEKKLDDFNGTTVLLYCIGLLFASLAMYFADCSDIDFITGGVTCVTFGGLGFVILATSSPGVGKIGCVPVVTSIIALGFYAVYWLLLCYDFYIDPNVLLVMIVVLALATLLIHRVTFMTPYRRQAMGEILGLEEFIRISENQQLEQLQAEDEKYFYDILPYAVALGMGEIWAKKFANITVAPNENFVGYSGDSLYHTGNMMSAFYTPSFQAGIDKYHEAVAAASTAGSSHSSTSYSSGGGGFSGGGFGGGGGGSW